MADVLRAHGGAYLRRRGRQASRAERKALAELTACRTAALGRRSWYCDACGEVQVCYNSCRNRHCPTCGGAARARWLDRLRQDLLPVPYFHLVFTLPHELSQLCLANRRALYHLLFQSAWRTLRQLAADPRHLGGQLGAVMVLHTWGQNLEHHPHVHCVLPGGALAPAGDRWLPARSPKFLFPVRALSRLFRGKFLAGLKKLRAQGRLKLGGALAHLESPRDLAMWLSPLYRKEWVVYVQSPPAAAQGPEAVLKYLARYVAGAAISDARLLAHEGGRVTFRAKNYRQGKKRTTLTLAGVEFVRRFCLHVLPAGFPRVRYYGLLSNKRRGELIPVCRALLPPDSLEPTTAGDTSRVAGDDSTPECCATCPACGRGLLHLFENEARPSWHALPALTAPPPDTS